LYYLLSQLCDEFRKHDQLLPCCIEVNTNYSLIIPLHLKLTLRAGWWINIRNWPKWFVPIITTFCFIIFLRDGYNDRLLPLLKHFFPIPNGVNKFSDLRKNCFTTCYNQFCFDLNNTYLFASFQLSNSHRNLKGTQPIIFSNIYYKTYIEITLQTVLYIIRDLKKHITYHIKLKIKSITQ
jgi:hypothetical protein